jgi:GNAT superfamily N-acetyltransferase
VSGTLSRDIRLRGLRAGDAGWVIGRHGSLYAAEYGLDLSFEQQVAELVAGILRDFEAGQDFAVMAELDGVTVGSAFVVRHKPGIAKLRLVIVDPQARGLGIGRRLLDEAIRFARDAGYGRMTLWTMQMLTAARQLYAAAGFICSHSEARLAYGREVVDETWDLDLI